MRDRLVYSTYFQCVFTKNYVALVVDFILASKSYDFLPEFLDGYYDIWETAHNDHLGLVEFVDIALNVAGHNF